MKLLQLCRFGLWPVTLMECGRLAQHARAYRQNRFLKKIYIIHTPHKNTNWETAPFPTQIQTPRMYTKEHPNIRNHIRALSNDGFNLKLLMQTLRFPTTSAIWWSWWRQRRWRWWWRKRRRTVRTVKKKKMFKQLRCRLNRMTWECDLPSFLLHPFTPRAVAFKPRIPGATRPAYVIQVKRLEEQTCELVSVGGPETCASQHTGGSEPLSWVKHILNKGKMMKLKRRGFTFNELTSGFFYLPSEKCVCVLKVYSMYLDFADLVTLDYRCLLISFKIF